MVSIHGAAKSVGATSCLSNWAYKSGWWSCISLDSWYNWTCSAIMSGRYWALIPRRNIRCLSMKNAWSSVICVIKDKYNVLLFTEHCSCLLCINKYISTYKKVYMVGYTVSLQSTWINWINLDYTDWINLTLLPPSSMSVVFHILPFLWNVLFNIN